MLIEDTSIYIFIKDYLDQIPILNVKKGKYFSKAILTDDQLYYILEGKVKIECTSYTGKKVLVDELSENEFAGQISYTRKENFYCDASAITDLKLLCIKHDIMDVLLKNCEFSSMFYFKTSKRIYHMYKKTLMRDLFCQCEIVAYHILKESKDGKLIYKSIYDICDSLNISRRNLYNILNKFIEDGIIEKEKKCTFVIKDENFLKEKIDKIEKFLDNKY